ncbi:hypothetical protein CCACVL1_07666 [Corchorus capsularis]|uniref:Uncharacterized protein n=1 Tax=Corchorus capsularis TaxID=210143 RepID=A0A1R3J4H9_COCAP|nr:hypothetical protein CCACVL1_07666 [Corchorus capsularis]
MPYANSDMYSQRHSLQIPVKDSLKPFDQNPSTNFDKTTLRTDQSSSKSNYAAGKATYSNL